MFDHYERLSYVWTNITTAHSVEFTKAPTFLNAIQYAIKHLALYVEGENKKIIDVFNIIIWRVFYKSHV